ncbi:hypothetical protein FRC07_004807 [Ceratobasidium sp. 392]|nr:hypothetical protein FRC07_004807 [Ceratobasidium sp. 392]
MRPNIHRRYEATFAALPRSWTAEDRGTFLGIPSRDFRRAPQSLHVRVDRGDHVSRSTSWIDDAKHTLCYAHPPVIRSRFAQSAYWIIYRARLELCCPRPPISASLPKLPPLSPPSVEPSATRTKGGDTLATRTRPATSDQPANPKPAHAGIRWQSRRRSHAFDSTKSRPRPLVKARLAQRGSRVASWLATLAAAAVAARAPIISLVVFLVSILLLRLYKLIPASNQQLAETRRLAIRHRYFVLIEAYRSSREVYTAEHEWTYRCNLHEVASVEWVVWFHVDDLVWKVKQKYGYGPGTEVRLRLTRVREVVARYRVGSQDHEEQVLDDDRNRTDVFESEDEFLRGTTPAELVDEWDESMREAPSSRSPSPPPSPPIPSTPATEDFNPYGWFEPDVRIVEA